MVKRLVEKSKHDLVCFLGDDTIPQHGFLREALKAMKTLPDGWGLVALNDKVHQGRLATHWLADKRLLPLIGGEFFHTGYSHCFCDSELTLRCHALGRYVFAEKAVIVHDHPVVRGEALDVSEYPGYESERFARDNLLFIRRRRRGWK
jgi:GT2 family glycosyltransferase